jgi:hypothetical protein
MSTNDLVAIRHGRFVVEVPEGWTDDSTISLIAPTEQAMAAPLSPRQPPRYAANVHVTLEMRPPEITDPVQFLTLMGESLQEAGVELADVAPPEPFEMGGRDAAVVERRVVLNGQAVRQTTAIALLEHNAIVASASTSESEADHDRAMLLDVLRRVRFA